jgi:hypothetical protein
MPPLRQNKQPHSFYPAVLDRVEEHKQRPPLVGSAWLTGMRLCGSDTPENPSAAGNTLVRGWSKVIASKNMYHWHLPPFGWCVLFISKTLRHGGVDSPSTP